MIETVLIFTIGSFLIWIIFESVYIVLRSFHIRWRHFGIPTQGETAEGRFIKCTVHFSWRRRFGRIIIVQHPLTIQGHSADGLGVQVTTDLDPLVRDYITKALALEQDVEIVQRTK